LAAARGRVRRLRDLYMHAAIYAVVMGGLALFNWVVSPAFWWVAFPAIAWGVGLAAHAISVLFEDSLFNARWEERKTRELLERQRGPTAR
jgi:hypothetical protein